MFQCNKCAECKTKPFIREGSPSRDGENVYFVHIYKCRDEGSPFNNQDIGEVKIDFFDNSNQIETYY